MCVHRENGSEVFCVVQKLHHCETADMFENSTSSLKESTRK